MVQRQIRKLFQKNDPTVKPQGTALSVVHGDPVSNGSAPDRVGWVSPNYSQSRQVTLDPDHLAANRCIAFGGDSGELDRYRILRTQIMQRMEEMGGKTLMITSAVPGEGKTLTAINLALTFAKEYHQTALLVDCNLKEQRVHQYLGIDSDAGLIDYLLDDRPIPELMIWPGVEKLTLISGGRHLEESCELLGSPRMRDLVQDMRSRYPNRYVLFDMPAVSASADALVFASMVDGILLVVQAGQTRKDDIEAALNLLPREKVVGVVFNQEKPLKQSS